MKHFNRVSAQGDMLIIKLDSVTLPWLGLTEEGIPKDAKQMMPENGSLIIAHSETGHHHAVSAQDAQGFRPAANDDMILYLAAQNKVDFRHLRSFDTHETIRANPGNYQIRRQREYTPRGWRRVED